MRNLRRTTEALSIVSQQYSVCTVANATLVLSGHVVSNWRVYYQNRLGRRNSFLRALSSHISRHRQVSFAWLARVNTNRARTRQPTGGSFMKNSRFDIPKLMRRHIDVRHSHIYTSW